MLAWHKARSTDMTLSDGLRRFHARAVREIRYEAALPQRLAKELRLGWSWSVSIALWHAHEQNLAWKLRRARARARLT